MISLKLIDHECELVSCTDDSRKAWIISRNEEAALDDSFRKMNTPVNEFNRFTIRIITNVLTREIITSLRNHIVWSRTSRVDDYSQTIPVCLTKDQYNKYASVLLNYSDIIDSKMKTGLDQDQWRTDLPLCLKSEFTINIDDRTLRSLIPYLKKYECSKSLGVKLEKLVNINSNYYNSKSIIPTLTNYDPNTNIINNKLVSLDTEISIALRAQLVRHRYLSIQDNLEDLLNDPDWSIKTMNDVLKVRIITTPEYIQSILSHRLCWIAQTDLWSDLLESISTSDGFTSKLLPCKGNGEKCAYLGDQNLRINNEDPNPPCPIYCVSNKIKLSVSQKFKIAKLSSRKFDIFTNHVRKMMQD